MAINVGSSEITHIRNFETIYSNPHNPKTWYKNGRVVKKLLKKTKNINLQTMSINKTLEIKNGKFVFTYKIILV